MLYFLKLLLVADILSHVYGEQITNESETCEELLDEELKEEIASYGPARDKILKYVLEGEFKGRTFKELTKFINKFGGRLTGTENLENSIDYMINLTIKEDIHNITAETLKVPQWTRGKEEITMLKPRDKNMALIGLGNSVATPKDGITAEVVVVDSFEELEKVDAKGKIVVFNVHFTTYSETVKYRFQAATRAAGKGALASLVRSVTMFSIYSPHAGMQKYGNETIIPTAAITLEDANLLKRLYTAGEKIVINLKMLSKLYYNTSRNTLVDIIVSGHIDSWDNGEGAMDDGGGLMISWAVPVILKKMKLEPRRTIRTIFWTAEEQQYVGAEAYEKKHRHEEKNINFALESDDGTFAPRGLQMLGTQKARCIVAEVLKLFKVINASTLIDTYVSATDINVFLERGVPGAGLLNDNGKYYWYHHTAGDTMDLIDEKSLDLCTAFWTAVSYIIADLSVDIPRNDTTS
ncbi:hypothetical protein ABMA28_016099 [Loxostege sticticalis]|uniref:Carboxypeptidase Q n=1 Tax=Loxostege sticticalis TaxID=481309 RepID=A0ABD0T847_LOXSC